VACELNGGSSLNDAPSPILWQSMQSMAGITQKRAASRPASERPAQFDAYRHCTPVNFQIEIVPADGIRLPFFIKRRLRNVAVFWAARSQAINSPCINVPFWLRNTNLNNSRLTLGGDRQKVSPNFLLQRGRRVLAHSRDGGRPSWRPVIGVVLPPL
jgi:hypothetical protein